MAIVVLPAWLPDFPVFLFAAALLAGGVAVLYRQIVRFRRHVEETVGALLSPTEAADPAVISEVAERYPLAVTRRSFHIAAGSAAAGQTIQDLHVRARTGATVVSIHRQGEDLINPSPETRLVEGDRVVLVGEPDHLEEARLLLRAEGAPPERVALIRLEPGAPFTGASLASSDVRRRTGATVVSVRRGTSPPLAPRPDMVLQEGDVLEAIGSEKALQSLRLLCMGDAAPD